MDDKHFGVWLVASAIKFVTWIGAIVAIVCLFFGVIDFTTFVIVQASALGSYFTAAVALLLFDIEKNTQSLKNTPIAKEAPIAVPDSQRPEHPV
jgi:hypothetical protein